MEQAEYDDFELVRHELDISRRAIRTFRFDRPDGEAHERGDSNGLGLAYTGVKPATPYVGESCDFSFCECGVFIVARC